MSPVGLAAAHGHHLIVIGSRGHFLGDYFLGSSADRVAHHAHCPRDGGALMSEDRERTRYAAVLAAAGAGMFIAGALPGKQAGLLMPWGAVLLVLGGVAVLQAVLIIGRASDARNRAEQGPS